MAERADPRYPEFREGSVWREKLFERYNFCNEYIKDKVVLDIPCGIGWGSSLLKGAKKVYGVDISEEAVDYGRKNYKKVDFKVGDMTSIPSENDFFDVLICLEGYEHVNKEKQLKFIEEAKRVLKKDGIIIITTPLLGKDGNSTGNPYHIHEPPLEEVKEIFLNNFESISFDISKGPTCDELRFVGKNR